MIYLESNVCRYKVFRFLPSASDWESSPAFLNTGYSLSVKACSYFREPDLQEPTVIVRASIVDRKLLSRNYLCRPDEHHQE
jgi:hypothetical protein